MPEHVGRDADIRAAREEAVDLLASRRERHRPVEHRNAVGAEAVHLARQREHRPAAERDDDRSGRQRAELTGTDELEGQLSLVDAHLRVGESMPHERQCVERAEQSNMAVLAREEQLRPGCAALLVVGPLHFVEHEHLAGAGRHLDGAAEDRRSLVDPLLARDQADAVLAEPSREPAMGLLREHPQRAGVDASPPLREELERIVRLPGVRRAEVRDDGLGRCPPLGQTDRDAVFGAPHRRALVRAGGPCVPRRARRAARRTGT